ncbi:uncharacterized protein LOC131952197, partial [Physella acuta]|uniref:uncharacterized protein LOC131952197 n=1 Tax=Physella acuta TaxID=109671 RepID=UPI0027DBC0DD
MSDQICEFWLEIENKLTMMADKDAVYPANGKLYKYDVTNTSAAVPIDPIHVITADGWEKSRLVIVVNKTMPGPPIEVFEGQTVIVHVKNKLMSEGLSVHWHGLQQRQTPWMDGVAYVTQCPILPGQTFTYRFKADHVGSFWYHSHLGTQLSMGLIGAFIVRKKEDPPMKEYIMMLQDWNHDMDANLLHHKMLYGNYENRTKLSGTKSLEGGMF